MIPQDLLPQPAPPSLSNVVVKVLREMISHGHFQPGEHLKEAELASALKVSRGPVREALTQLAAEGHVELRRHRGAFVSQLTRVDVEEVHTLRAAIERLAAERACVRMGPAEFATMDAVLADMLAAARWAEALPDGNGKLGAVGFCYGGGIVNMLATMVPTLRASVPFYGSPPTLSDVPAIKAEMLVQMAGNDTRLVGLWPEYEAALKAAGVKYEGFIYPGVEHGFNNDTTPRYDAGAAKLAWQRMLAFFNQELRG